MMFVKRNTCIRQPTFSLDSRLRGNDAGTLFCLSTQSILLLLVVSFFQALPISACMALEPGEIIVVANSFVPESVDLARYYMKARDIPSKNLLKIRTTDKEHCSRAEYEDNILKSVREFIQELKEVNSHPRCIVTMIGMPLKIEPTEMNPDEKVQYNNLQDKKNTTYQNLQSLDRKHPDHKSLTAQFNTISAKINKLTNNNERASLDSELTLVLEEFYNLDGHISNPHFVAFQGKLLPVFKENVMLVSRLDGPDEETVKRIIDDSIAVEKTGLKGTAYFDARWKNPGNKGVQGYGYYDRSIHRAADVVKRTGKFKVVLNDKQELFQPGDCPDSALYCGWYSHGRYVDAFTWNKGAVGYHIASSECTTLKNKNSTVWCKMMLEKGIAATIGPVGEPYVSAFPPPDIFFTTLLDGRLSLVEAYFASLPSLSWQMVLIGDPLYRPFKNSH